MVVLAYLLDTARVNAQTIWSLVTNKNPRGTNSLQFGYDIALALILPQIENRPLIGLQGPVQRKMSFMLKRPVGKFGAVALQPPPAAGGAAAVVAGAAAAARNAVRSMTSFARYGEKEKRCHFCYIGLPSEGHKIEKNSITKIKTLCGSCGQPCCKKHYTIICSECQDLFTPRQ